MTVPEQPLRGEMFPGGEGEEPHFAISVFARIDPELARRCEVRILKEKKHGRNGVYWLLCSGASEQSVVAKRTFSRKAQVERDVYTRILPRLNVPAIRFLGIVDEPGEESSWIFTERATGAKYDPGVAQHRICAAEYLAELHGAMCEPPERMPEMGSSFLFAHVASAADRLGAGLSNPAAKAADRLLLADLLRLLQVVERNWEEVDSAVTGAPAVVVHGDFAPKNMLVRTTTEGSYPLVFDWGSAGRSFPGLDLAQRSGAHDNYWVSPDLDVYSSAVGSFYGGKDDLRRLAAYGKLIRTFSTIDIDSKPLAGEWIHRPLAKLGYYHSQLMDVCRALRWVRE